MDQTNKYSPQIGENLSRYTPAELLSRILSWHHENTLTGRWKLVTDTTATTASAELLQTEWDTLCAAFVAKMDKADGELITVTVFSKSKQKDVTTYVFSEEYLRHLAAKLSLLTSEDLITSMFPDPKKFTPTPA